MKPTIQNLHAERTRIILAREKPDVERVKESIKSILLDPSLFGSTQPLKKHLLIEAIEDKIFKYPQVMSWDDMYMIYISNVNTKILSKRNINVKRIDKKPIDSVFVNSPWRTKSKANKWMKENNWSDIKREDYSWNTQRQSFNINKQKKEYSLHMIAPRNTYMIDYVFCGQYYYLFCINVNTRKLFAITGNGIKDENDEYYEIADKYKSTSADTIAEIKQLLRQTTVKYIISDKEPSFVSEDFKEFLESKDIQFRTYIKNDFKWFTNTYDKSRANHRTLAIIDRVIKTIRNMNYNLGLDESIEPRTMKLLVDEYNKSPHSTLSKILKRPTSPNDMNDYLEDVVVNQLAKENYIVRNKKDYNLVGKDVYIYNESSNMDKLKQKLLPNKWKVKSKEGSYFVCKDDKNNTLKVPRFMIKPIYETK